MTDQPETQVSDPLAAFMVPGSKYGYTAAPPATLQSFRNTLAVGLLDESGSTKPYARQMELFCKELIKSLRHSDDVDSIIYRQCHFGTDFREQHGFTPLAAINENNYDGCYAPGGGTAFYDAADRVLAELLDYGQQHASSKRLCNGFFFAITDGRDYDSTLKPRHVKERLESIVTSEKMESIFSVLIGVNDNDMIQQELKKLKEDIGFSAYIELSKADEKSLSKLMGWVSQQLQSQSQALGTGGPSQALTF